MRKLVIACLLSFLFCLQATAQQGNSTSDVQQIETVINWYFDGWGTGDTTKLGKAMHSSCQLKYFNGNKFSVISRADYLSRSKPHTRPDSLITRLVSLDITGNIASVKAEIITATDIFTDYFNMIKTDVQWFIVDKVSVRRPK